MQATVMCDGKIAGQAHDIVRVNQIRLSRLVLNMDSFNLDGRSFIPIDVILDEKSVPTRIISANSGVVSDCGKYHTLKDVVLEVLDETLAM